MISQISRVRNCYDIIFSIRANLIISESIHAPQFLEDPFLNDLDNIIVLDYRYRYERKY
jgi:hypothetical protein